MTMTEAYQVEATIDLITAQEGGLHTAVPSGTRSLLLEFKRMGTPVTLGAELRTQQGTPIKPGAKQLSVLVLFWADEAASIASPSQRFSVWYGRKVGTGRVHAVVTEARKRRDGVRSRKSKTASGAA